jgi:hypothetical protein
MLISAIVGAAPQARAIELGEAYDALHQKAADFSAASKAKADQQAAQAAPAEDETCQVCWSADFKPLNDKARAVKAWEDKRLEVSVAAPIAGFAVLGALLSPNPQGAMEEGTKSYMKLKREADALQAQGVSLGGLEIKDGFVRLKIVKGVDYVLEQPASK